MIERPMVVRLLSQFLQVHFGLVIPRRQSLDHLSNSSFAARLVFIMTHLNAVGSAVQPIPFAF